MDGKKKTQRGRTNRKKPNWCRRRLGRPKKKKRMEPRVGRPKYDEFRANEVKGIVREMGDSVTENVSMRNNRESQDVHP